MPDGSRYLCIMEKPHLKTETLVLGAGISGLSAAYELHKQNRDFLILEKDNRAGGVIDSFEKDGLVLERGPNSLVATEEIMEVCRELGLEDQIVYALPSGKIRQILWNDRLHTLKPSPSTLFTTKLLSSRGKIRALSERFRNAASADNVSVHDFFERRFGKEVATRLAGAIVSGIYAGDARELEMRSIFPSILDNLEEHGSVLKSVIKRSGKPRKIINFKRGLGQFTQALSEKIEDNLHLNLKILGIKSTNDGYLIKALKNGEQITIESKNILSTLPQHALLKVLPAEMQDSMPRWNVHYNPMLTIQVFLKTEEALAKTQGFGFLAPPAEREDFIGMMYNGHFFSTTRNTKDFLANVFIKPDKIPYQSPEVIMDKLVKPQLKKWTGLKEIKMVYSQLWPEAIPQKTIGHHQYILALKEWTRKHPGFYISGNWVNGVSLGDCVADNRELARNLT